MAPLQPEMRQKPDGQRGPGKLQRPSRGTLIWWLVMVGLMAWNVVTFWPKTNPEVTLPYTTFLDQVRSENVAKVQVTGDEITGTFLKAFRWPEVAPSTPPAQSPESGESKPPVTASPGATKTQSPGAASPETQKAQSQSAAATRAPVKAAPGAAKTQSPDAASAEPQKALSQSAAEIRAPVKAAPGATKTQSPGAASVEPQKAESRGAAETKAPVKAASGAAKKETPTDYKSFKAIFPENIGDPGLLPLLESHKVAVEVEPPPSHWFALLLTYGFPILLLVGLFAWMGNQASHTQGGILGFGRSKARRYTSDRPQVTFADVAGAEEAKADLQEEVDFLKSPAKYHQLGARIPRGVLLVGQPGTGKTLLARAVAGEARVPFFTISASEFVEMFVGVGASRVRSLFEEAKAAAPAIVFIDELDAVGRRRGAGLGQTNDEREQTLNQLLVEMDGFDERHEVIVLAATNRPDVLDPALLRPGRFDREVTVGLPDRTAREGILRIHSRKLTLAHDVDISVLARSTTGMSGADLANLCNEAALIAARVGHNEISMGDFEEAIDKVMLGAARPALRNPSDRRVVAYHEAGHAVAAWYTPEADPVHKLTIIPHGRALGVTEQLPVDDRYNYSRTYLLARLSVMLGGRTSEEIVLGDITTGAENDLVEATRMARRMVTRWGMGNLGLVAFKSDEVQPFLGYELSQGRDYSEATAASIDHEVRQLLAERHDVVTDLLKSKRAQLDLLVEALLQSESIGQAELVKLLGPRSETFSSVSSNPGSA